jgi:DNA-directed RNA polymerase subunit K
MRPKGEYSHYEKVRIISARALQISQGAPVLVKVPKHMTNPMDIAKLEWEKDVIPIDSKRKA